MALTRYAGYKPALMPGEWDGPVPDVVETDVVVVGSGAAGLAAANGAVADGADVVVLEAAAELGGTSAKSGGGFLVCDNDLLRANGIHEDRSTTLRLLARTAFPDRYDPQHPLLGLEARDHALIAAFYDRSNEVVTALVDDHVLAVGILFSIQGDPRGFPSYFTQLEEETIYYGRTLGPMTADGTGGAGRELIRQLAAGAERRGARLLCGQRVTELVVGDGAVVGVRTAGHTFLARRGVVLATGGFAHNLELQARWMTGLVMGSCAVPESRGDAIALTEDLDVELDHVDRAWLGQVPVEIAVQTRDIPAVIFVPYGDSMVLVDGTGRRVVNEKAPYDQRAKVHFERDAHGDQPNRLLFMVYDDAVAGAEEFETRWPIPPAGTTAPYVISAPTLEELEAQLRRRLEALEPHTRGFTLSDGFASGLAATIATFNGYAERGRDEEFGRGEQPFAIECSGQRRPGNHPNPTMYPMSTDGPFHCIVLAAGMLDTKGGPRIDPSGRIVRADGTPVPGLYGAGNCVASPSGQGYWAGGTTLGLGMTFGYVAGRDAARAPSRAHAQLAATSSDT